MEIDPLFATAEDFVGFKMVQDSRHGEGLNMEDISKNQAGMACWMTPRNTCRICDIRWVFPDRARALDFHRANLAMNSEGRDPLETSCAPLPPDVALEYHLYGGTDRMAQALGLRLNMFIFLFVVGRAVVKLFVSQIRETPLDLHEAHGYAQAVLRRVARAEPTLRESGAPRLLPPPAPATTTTTTTTSAAAAAPAVGAGASRPASSAPTLPPPTADLD
ncbi:hypothetical protein PAPYR_6053 [Paratrimastix pyriformis]|uniref:Uncharacterized protein n=1 Tax=Paratrimastix pyriformis TaxID=342808 RepID=A0ABQ8UG55_9EUKA|nr:hypothetical protein PAPYR_6053 [Paratrimastix pyriformis]